MKNVILSFIFFFVSWINAEVDIPNSLKKTIQSFLNDSNAASIYRIDIVIFENLKISHFDKEETWYGLSPREFSENLVELPEESSLLVNKDSIKHGLEETSALIKKVEFSKKEVPQEELISNSNQTKFKLSVELFEKVEDKNLLKVYKTLNKNDNYKVLYKRSWYQPIFNKKLSFPVLVLGNNLDKVIFGELRTYKERYLHGEIKLKYSSKNSRLDYIPSINKLYNFNNLKRLIKENNEIKEDTYFWQKSFLPKMNISFIDLKKWFDYLPIIPNEINNQEEIKEINTDSYSVVKLLDKNQYELHEERKMVESKWHYIDHPYFGVLVQITPWETK